MTWPPCTSCWQCAESCLQLSWKARFNYFFSLKVYPRFHFITNFLKFGFAHFHTYSKPSLKYHLKKSKNTFKNNKYSNTTTYSHVQFETTSSKYFKSGKERLRCKHLLIIWGHLRSNHTELSVVTAVYK